MGNDEPKTPLPKKGEVSDLNPYGKPDACTACSLYQEPGIVWGNGNRNAKILYLGEAPGGDEVDYPKHRPERMRPFVGGSGRLRDVLLSHAGLDKKVHLYTTNCVKCRPPGNRLPTDLEVAACAPFLIEEIEDVNPNLILAAGEVALNVVADKKKIGLWRGVPTAGYAGRKVFPTWHPAFIARAQYNWAFAVHDLVRAKAQSEFPEIRRVPVNIVRNPKPETDGVHLLHDARKRGAATFDFETSGLSASTGQILMCGIVARPDTAEVYHWTPSARELLEAIVDDPEIEICGQNVLSFDLPFMEDKGHRIRWTRVFDTMVAFHLCNSSYGQTSVADQNKGELFKAMGAEKDLSFIASNHTDIEYWKSRDSYKNDLVGVCGVDCIATDRAAYHPTDGIKAELKRYGMESLYYDHVLPVHPVLRYMTKRGVRIDEDRAAKWSVLLEQNADRMELELATLSGGINLQSPKQMMEFLYGKTEAGGLGLPVQYLMDKKKGRRPTANADAIDTLATMFPQHQILRNIVDIRHLRKMKSTYIDPGLMDGRLHPRFGVSKASNGRFNGWNPNAQNVPEVMRDVWVPDSDDFVLISADSSQIEWRAAMVLSGDEVGLELLARGVDNHRAIASEALSIPYDEVTDDQRHAAKFIVYGLGYGRGASSIAAGHGLDIRFVETFIGRFFRRFGGFSEWREALIPFVRDNHYLVNPWGRRRWWYTREITEIYNFPASSTAADMMIDECIAIDRELPKGADMRLTVHDEVVVHAHKDVVRDAILCIKTHMQAPQPKVVEFSRYPENVKKFYPNGWFCPADVHVGTDWSMCKSKDPQKKKERAALEQHLGVGDLCK
jgi:uracil-DNA glycosylase family 4